MNRNATITERIEARLKSDVKEALDLEDFQAWWEGYAMCLYDFLIASDEDYGEIMEALRNVLDGEKSERRENEEGEA